MSFLLLFCASTFAASSENKAPHHSGTLSSVNLGARYSSLLASRGVILYRDFQIDPVIGIFLFDDRLEFLGDSLSYRDFIFGDQVRLRTKLATISDKPLFPVDDSVRNSSPMREDSYELSAQVEFFLPGYNSQYQSEVDFSLAKDLNAHQGIYMETQGKFKIFDFRVASEGPKIEPNLFASLGWGDSRHNQYLYGPSADSSGLNNFSYGLWFAFPEEADRYYPIIQLKHFEALGNFRNSEFAVGRNEGWLLSFIATYGVFTGEK